ncbi:FAD-dependent oxidoreductase [Patescibacteria group bacterium]|nr:FAD-dependent oxidoreductase [Patescibacteria group bacterium]
MSKQKLVLLGGGFAGTWIATHACPAHNDQLEVTLISEESHFTFSPLLINGLAGDLDPQDFTIDLAKLATERGFRFVQGKISLVNREKQIVEVEQTDGKRSEIAYDQAVLATGSEANFFDIPGLKEASFALKRLSDIDRLINHLETVLVTASKTWTDEDKRKLLSFLIVGGGPTGVELLGAMRERLRRIAENRGLEDLLPLISITLVESNNLLFYGFPEHLSQQSEQVLKQGGVDIRCGVRVTGVEKGVATLSDNSSLNYHTLIWAAGVKPVWPTIEPAFAPGPLKTDAFLRLDDHLYGAGDAITFEQNGVKFHKNAQFALQMAHDVLQNILRNVKGQPLVAPNRKYNAALVTVLQTGFFRLGSFVLQGPWIHPFRKLLYRFRLWQIRSGH